MANNKIQPNGAPDYNQILHSSQQPPHNPYYPNPATVTGTVNHYTPSPSYSANLSTPLKVTIRTATNQSVPMSQLNDISYPKISISGVGNEHIVIKAPGLSYNNRIEIYKNQICNFNRRVLILAFLAVISSLYAHHLYGARACHYRYVIGVSNNNLIRTVGWIEVQHVPYAIFGGLLMLICTLRAAIGYSRSNSYGCYLTLVGLLAFLLAVGTARLAYLTFYSTCAASLENLFSNSAKTLISKFTDSVPSPDRGVFYEANVFQYAKEDSNGVVIFILDFINFTFYLSIFLSTLTSCS